MALPAVADARQTPPDPEYLLTDGDGVARVSAWGASLRGFGTGADPDTAPVVAGYQGRAHKAGGQGDVLIPFPGRVANGQYTFGGTTFQMERGDKDGPNAIHGFVRNRLWDVTEQTESAITFATSLTATDAPGYPFALRITVTYTVDSLGLRCAFTVENTGDGPAPVAAGFHPYFTVGSEHIDADTLTVPFAATLEMENLIPTGQILPVAGTGFDFRAPRPIGDTKFNTCYLQPTPDADGLTRIVLRAPEGRALTVWMEAAFAYVVLYSGDPLPESHRRRMLAIEPMTCAADGFNHPEWGLTVLAPGQTRRGAWGVTPE